MEPQNPLQQAMPETTGVGRGLNMEQPGAAPPPDHYRGLRWIFTGPQGLRAGWSVMLFLLIFIPASAGMETAFSWLHLIGKGDDFSAPVVFVSEAGALIALLFAMAVIALIERRPLWAYNLTGEKRLRHFAAGLVAGFLALSSLVGALMAGGWLHLGGATLPGPALLRFAVIWGCAFLIGAGLEEGTFRCYGLFTLTRGLNFWWALAVLAVACAYQAIFVHGTASWGVYAAALLGVVPCYILHQRAARGAGFWCAAWVTSTLFGFVHVSNPGEAWVGIFSAAFIGFVFCLSIRLTGSAWWAIGCHAAWDWGETYFYGTADSGLRPHGSYLTSTPAGNPLWSGGSVGPEGSLLVLGALFFLLVLILLYGRWTNRPQNGIGKAGAVSVS